MDRAIGKKSRQSGDVQPSCNSLGQTSNVKPFSPANHLSPRPLSSGMTGSGDSVGSSCGQRQARTGASPQQHFLEELQAETCVALATLEHGAVAAQTAPNPLPLTVTSSRTAVANLNLVLRQNILHLQCSYSRNCGAGVQCGFSGQLPEGNSGAVARSTPTVWRMRASAMASCPRARWYPNSRLSSVR